MAQLCGNEAAPLIAAARVLTSSGAVHAIDLNVRPMLLSMYVQCCCWCAAAGVLLSICCCQCTFNAAAGVLRCRCCQCVAVVDGLTGGCGRWAALKLVLKEGTTELS